MPRLVAFLVMALLGCSGSGSTEQAKPTGTPTDPVEVCERVADVCRLDGAKLGVCVEGQPDTDCEGRRPCFLCADQH